MMLPLRSRVVQASRLLRNRQAGRLHHKDGPAPPIPPGRRRADRHAIGGRIPRSAVSMMLSGARGVSKANARKLGERFKLKPSSFL